FARRAFDLFPHQLIGDFQGARASRTLDVGRHGRRPLPLNVVRKCSLCGVFRKRSTMELDSGPYSGGRVVATKRVPAGRRVQLHRACSKLGWGSRTQAVAWIRGGTVRVDGLVVTDPLTWVDLDRQHIPRVDVGGAEASGPTQTTLAGR